MVAPHCGAFPAPIRQSREAKITKPKSTSQAEPQGSNNGLELDPIIDAMLEHLPAPGDYWAKADRKRWLTIIEQVFDLIYVEERTGDVDPDLHEAMRPHGGQTT